MRANTSRTLLIACTVLTIGCGDDPLVFPDWEIPPAEDTRVVGYAAVPVDERTGELTLERQFVITEAFGRRLYEPADIEVAEDGTIFVLDRGNGRAIAFDPTGTPLYQMGNEGQGPGEFDYPRDVAVAGNLIVINDQGNSKFSLFNDDGIHARDHRFEQRLNTFEARGVGGEIVLFRYEPADEQPEEFGPPVTDWIVSRHALDGTELGRALRFRYRDEAYFVKDAWQGSVPIAGPWPVGAVGRDGVSYFSSGRHYQVLAFGLDGVPQWALRAAYAPEVPSEVEKRQAASLLHDQWEETMPGFNVTYDDVHWPESYPAIEGLQVDGRGNLYVFPFSGAKVDPNADARPVPVDVYSANADRLFAGFIDITYWQAAHGNRVYRIETDAATEERVVAGYRLTTPFD